jgi:fibronectin type 3 domain-containing protein
MRSIGLKMLFNCLFMSLLIGLQAQSNDSSRSENKPSAIMLARVNGKNVQLRWFPMNTALWRTANQKGWVVERMPLSEAGSAMGFKPLSKTPFKPLTDREWLGQTDTANKYVTITRQAIWKGTSYPTTGKFEDIQAYQNEENALFSYFLLSVSLSDQAAKGAALGFDDATAERGKAYMYRAYIAGEKTDTVWAIIRDWETPSVKSVENVRVEEGEGAVTLFWQTAKNDNHFIAYDIERSADGGKTFRAMNRHPFFIASETAPELRYVDSVKNYQPHHYRIVGYTYFGDKGKPSKTILGMGRDRSPAIGAVNIRADGTPNKVTVRWDLPATSADLAGFYVGRSNDSEGQFKYLNTKLLPPNARSFEDNQPQVLQPFYSVYAVDTAGNISAAYPAMASVYDTIPPARPSVLRGVCDTNGIVRLTWEAGKELDLQGYYVYRANGRDDVFRPLSKAPSSEPFFEDTVSMKALNREIYYKVTALDFNYNPSPYSDLLVVLRPDILPPAPPVFSNYEVKDNAVNLTWQNSASRDVLVYTLKRRVLAHDTEGGVSAQKEVSFEKINEFAAAKSIRQFSDTQLRGGKTYEYVLEAKDSSGNTAQSRPIKVQILAQLAAKEIENLKIEADKETGEAKLTWRYAAAENDPRCRYVIYRSRVGESLSTYESVAGKTPQYVETLPKNETWQYAIKAIHADGSESNLSSTVVVKF